MSQFISGHGKSTQIGFTNPNGQTCNGTANVPGTDHMQYAYWLECGHCSHDYGANGSDIFQRRCPNCQGGVPRIPYAPE